LKGWFSVKKLLSLLIGAGLMIGVAGLTGCGDGDKDKSKSTTPAKDTTPKEKAPAPAPPK
jgi:hypothetical protein